MDIQTLTGYCYDSAATQEWLGHLQSSHCSADKLTVRSVKNVWLIPDQGLFEAFSGGVYSQDGTPIPESFQRTGLQTAKELFENTDLQQVDTIEQEVVYLGQYRNQWGSFLVDSISRLWFSLEHPEKYTYVYLATQEHLGGIHANAYKLLERFGIQAEQILYITKPAQLKSVIIPEQSYTPLKHWHREYLDIIGRIVENSSCNLTENYEKVYFSRSKFSSKSKTDFGEEMIVSFMRENGFHIVYPEEHTLEEQIYYVNHCEVFASVGGSCAHNIIFSRTKPKMILFNRMNGYQWHQWMLDEMAGVEPITYVDCYCEPYKPLYKTTLSGPYLYWINKNVKRFAADHGMVLPQISLGKRIMVLSRYTIECIHVTIARWKTELIKH